MGPTAALVGKRSPGDYLAYAAPDIDDPHWTCIENVRYDPALGAMPANGSALRTLTLSEVLAEAPAEECAWIREVTEEALNRQLREIDERVDQARSGVLHLDTDVDLDHLAAIAAAAASVYKQLLAAAHDGLGVRRQPAPHSGVRQHPALAAAARRRAAPGAPRCSSTRRSTGARRWLPSSYAEPRDATFWTAIDQPELAAQGATRPEARL